MVRTQTGKVHARSAMEFCFTVIMFGTEQAKSVIAIPGGHLWSEFARRTATAA